jgi:iron complex transport system substrate-binding protein
MLVFTLAACTTDMADEPLATDEVVETAPSSVLVEHKLGIVEIALNPVNVVSLDMATVDTLSALGVEGVLTGVSSNPPAYLVEAVAGSEDVGTMFEPDFEAIAELQPDVIFISARSASVYDDLAEIAPVVYLNYPGIDDPDIVDTVAGNVTLLGEIFGKEEEATALVDELRAAVADASESIGVLDDRDALMLIVTGKTINAYGPEAESRYGYVFNIFNFSSTVSQEDLDAEANKHGQSISYEFIAEIDPDYIFVIDRGIVTGSAEIPASDTLDNGFVEQTKAFQNGNIVYVSPEEWYLTVGGYGSLMTIVSELASMVQ